MPQQLPPRIINFDHPVPIGLSGSNVTQVADCERKGLLVSEPHYRLPSGGWSGGGPFYTYQQKLKHGRSTIQAVKFGAGGTYHIGGVNVAPAKLPLFHIWRSSVPPWPSVKSDVESYYATGYARARPGNPVADLGQFIVELRDLPAVPFRRALKGGASFKSIPRIALNELKDFRNLGSEYLNVVFGWKPFVSDLRKMYYLWQTIDKRMAQIVRENGKNIRRRATVESGSESGSTTSTQGYPWHYFRGAPPNWTSGSSFLVHETTTKYRVWFSGSFRYYIPDTSSSLWDKRARLALFGALPTPELLWNVLPWSWLVDWFGNVGDVISNASPNAVDNLTSRYSYIMKSVEVVEEWNATSTWSALGPNPLFGGTFIPPGEASTRTRLTTVTKCRSGSGNPFGLGVKLESLTGYQLGILAALGLSRSSVK